MAIIYLERSQIPRQIEYSKSRYRVFQSLWKGECFIYKRYA